MNALPYTIHDDVIQGSEEWHLLRTGVITASKLGPFILESTKVAEKAKLTLVCRKLGEIAGEVEDVWPDAAMKRGTALETIAREQYRKLYGLKAVEVGFVSRNGYPLGCSPDGLEIEDSVIVGGQEIKGPQPSTHIRWLLSGGLPEEHKFQVHACMAVTDAPWWDFFSFCPRVTRWDKESDKRAWRVLEWNPGIIPPHYVRVMRDDFTERLKDGLFHMCDVLESNKVAVEAIRKSFVAGKEAA